MVTEHFDCIILSPCQSSHCKFCAIPSGVFC